jgi:predicted dehydrogenase
VTAPVGTAAAIIGSGWMSTVHTEALRRIGVEVRGIAGLTAENARQAADAMGIPRAYDSVDEALGDPEITSVHIVSPNDVHVEQAAAALRAGKHVVCEKPLGVDSSQAADLVALAAGSGLVNAVCFNVRFYPHNHNAAGLVSSGAIGDPRFVSGSYHQDWLALDTDWNWRLEAARQGHLRAVGDIGSHWLDLVSFVSGRRVTEVFADLTTFITERQRPSGEVKTFAAAGDGSRVPEPMASDDAAALLLRLEDGARGACTVSQVSFGRKNRISWELSGTSSSLAWCSEDPEMLWIGHRGSPNEIMQTDPSLMSARGAAVSAYPVGHVQGYPDTFRALFSAVYSDIARGGPEPDPAYPTFADGHDVMLVCDAIVESARTGTWAPVRRK